MSGVQMKDLRLGVLALFVEAQAVARDISDEKFGNVRADYLSKKSLDNSSRWAEIKSNPLKRAARNERKRALYDPAKRQAYYSRSGK